MHQPPWMIGAGWPDPDLAEAVLGGPHGRLRPLAWRAARALAATAGLLLFTQVQHPRQIMDAPSSAHAHLATVATLADREAPVFSMAQLSWTMPLEYEESPSDRLAPTPPDNTDIPLNVAAFMERVARTNLQLARAMNRLHQEAAE